MFADKTSANTRAAGADEALKLTPREEKPGAGIEFIDADELLEVTPVCGSRKSWFGLRRATQK